MPWWRWGSHTLGPLCTYTHTSQVPAPSTTWPVNPRVASGPGSHSEPGGPGQPSQCSQTASREASLQPAQTAIPPTRARVAAQPGRDPAVSSTHRTQGLYLTHGPQPLEPSSTIPRRTRRALAPSPVARDRAPAPAAVAGSETDPDNSISSGAVSVRVSATT